MDGGLLLWMGCLGLCWGGEVGDVAVGGGAGDRAGQGGKLGVII